MQNKSNRWIRFFLIGVAVILLLAAVLPLLYISKFSHPCADDYSYGLLTHQVWNTTHSFGATLQQAFLKVKESYDSWQGTHTSIFLMALSPAVFEGSIGYGVSAFIMMFMLVLSVTCTMYTLFVKIFKAKTWQAVFIAFVTIFWMIESVYSPVNAFFWFNGSVHYNFMHGCMLLMACNIMNYLIEKKEQDRTSHKVFYLMFASFFAFMCGGANYATALLGICILGLLLIWDIIFCKAYLVVVPFVTYLISFAISIFAPGNKERGTHFVGKGPAESIMESVKLAFGDELSWLDLQTVIILFILIPVLYSVAQKVDFKIRFWMVPVSMVMSFGLHAVMNVPLFFALGGGGLERQENICKFWFQLMVVINLFFIMCVLRAYIAKTVESVASKVTKNKTVRTMAVVMGYYLLLCVMMVDHMKTSDRALFQYSSYVAYVEVKTGEAASFYSTYETRLDILNSNHGDVVLPSYTSEPYLLYFDDITTEKKDWRNRSFAKWYHVKSVRK